MKARNPLGKTIFTPALLALCLTASAADPRDPYGGWPGVRGRATGSFHAEQIDGVWWLITPEGRNSNYGLVNIQDEPWTVLVTRVQTVNARIEEVHRQASRREGR
jgi:hypothetical protein